MLIRTGLSCSIPEGVANSRHGLLKRNDDQQVYSWVTSVPKIQAKIKSNFRPSTGARSNPCCEHLVTTLGWTGRSRILGRLQAAVAGGGRGCWEGWVCPQCRSGSSWSFRRCLLLSQAARSQGRRAGCHLLQPACCYPDLAWQIGAPRVAAE